MRSRAAWFFALLFLALLAARLCHADILWAEEGLPLAAALQMLHGRVLYLQAWFDKPPLLAALYLLWAAKAGWLLRLVGALYALGACALAFRFAGELWGRREAFWAAGLLAFFLTFDIPSAVVPLASDLLMLAPHLAAVYLAWRGRAFWSGVLAGVAFLFNPKGLFVLAACALWDFRGIPLLLAGFIVPNAAAVAWLAASGALAAYLEQVWRWGKLYAQHTFVPDPLRNGLVRTAHWLGFHAALALAAAWFWIRDRKADRWRWAAWALLSFAGVAAGWRFFPRYYFLLLPVLVLAAARGFALLDRRRALAVVALLLVPLVRFGPRYAILAADSLTGHHHPWADTAMDQDSRAAARLAAPLIRPGDTLFVWGFRPELYVYTGLPAASRFLDSQPLTGVPADRHLTQSAGVPAEFTSANRAELARSNPTFILDGLSLYNPALAIDRYPELRPWLSSYHEVARTPTTILYSVRRPSRAARGLQAPPRHRPRSWRQRWSAALHFRPSRAARGLKAPHPPIAPSNTPAASPETP